MEKEKLILNEMENFMKLSKIFYAFMVIVVIALAGVLYTGINNAKNIQYLVDDSLNAKQAYILEVAGKMYSPTVSPEALKPQVEQALGYCADTQVVHANGTDVTEQCDAIQDFATENYGG